MNPEHEPSLKHCGPLAEADAALLYKEVRQWVESGLASRALPTLVIELTQNMRLHGDSNGTLTVHREGDYWLLESRNEAGEAHTRRALDIASAANSRSPAQLREAIRAQRLRPHPDGEPGAGLGLLEMRRITQQPVEAAVVPPSHGGGKSMLVIKLRLAHKPPVADLDLPASMTTPKVHLPARGGEAWIAGACYPENAFAFFQPIFDWLRALRAAGGIGRKLELNIKLDYFNTSSSKCLLDLFQMLQEANAEGLDTAVRWHYCEDDSDMQETGEEFAQDLSLPFDLVPY